MSDDLGAVVNDEGLDALIARCSNRGRWGVDDELGTLNFITDARRAAAALLVREGRVVPMGKALVPELGPDGSMPVVRRMLYERHTAWAALDALEVAPHGLSVTHMDAVGHVYHEGRVYNGRQAADVVTQAGLGFGSIAAMRNGIFTRGVLLDVAAVRGVDWLRPGDTVTRADLEQAEAATGERVREGDAIVVRVGIGAMVAAGSPDGGPTRAGLGVDCMPWMHERGVAVYAGDCVERAPAVHAALPLPLHQIGMVAMGLALLDNPDVEPLTAACRSLGRTTFLLVVAPLDIPRGTGSAVNPLAIF